MGGGIGVTSEPFAYPATPHVRRHGPYGYKEYESYRAWLRDEFSFRCAFCLSREQWWIVKGMWDIDHFVPQHSNPRRKLDYENLLYTCHACNSAKSDQVVPDPCEVAFGECVTVHEDGTISALNEDGEILIAALRLDGKKATHFRRLIIDTLRSFVVHNETHLYIRWMGYPDDLPDLSRRNPLGNTRPEGVNDSCHARRIRGELPETY